MEPKGKSLNFIEQIIEGDLQEGLVPSKLAFRFPPEPNGHLHIGHAKAIWLNFGLGRKYNAPVYLRFDDTNPSKEKREFVDAIKADIEWLGFAWADERYASDYFEELFNWAILLIKKGKAYVDSQSSEIIAEQKGDLTNAGTNSPFRDRDIDENLGLFNRMKNGEFGEGEHVLRAKIDMASPNLLMRDPVIYRVLRQKHHRTGTNWSIYPLYDWAHGQSDYVEQISHSLCTLEFLPHRELYNWFLDQIVDQKKTFRPKQREFARLNLNYTIMSKRKLARLVADKVVKGWDDPRMPTLSGMRRRGYTPEAINKFAETVGIAKRDNIIDIALLEFCVRDHLNEIAPRVMAVMDSVKLVITNYPEGKVEWLETENNPEDPSAGTRKVPFSKQLYIERQDFREQANRKFFRLKLNNEVRLKSAYIIKANNVVKDENGGIKEIHCTYDPLSKSGSGTVESSRKIKGTLHWVSMEHAIEAEVRIYDRLFSDEAPDSHEGKDFTEFLNTESLKMCNAFLEPSLKNAKPGERFQFQRKGYFVVDNSSTQENLVFNRTVPLRDTWAKVSAKN